MVAFGDSPYAFHFGRMVQVIRSVTLVVQTVDVSGKDIMQIGSAIGILLYRTRLKVNVVIYYIRSVGHFEKQVLCQVVIQ